MFIKNWSETPWPFDRGMNGTLNIMCKSSVVDMNILYGRGEVDTPVRIRIA